ncbi:hypothetical protein [Mucilaginibacter ginsenosidivorax]|uniref:Uncharacterized protein n=1 Tax=Mucilaginibacter ginsenosidivorax TaxID=862126 RepID=A0A5B8W9L6_9SPHI|nr:hypothetical protein [Mucilaginibacter ginsenosidivorax]QEC79676.1 hypothetical protein FSB76_28355 [Mucilaginibacter ginsenosidivorax]
MKKRILYLMTGLTMGCNRPEKAQYTAQSPHKIIKENQIRANTISVDSLVSLYIHHSNNELVARSQTDLSVHEEALFDQEVKTDSANYLVYNIGHDVKDDDGQRFISDSWIYVDTLKRKVFEYTPDEKLVEWKH